MLRADWEGIEECWSVRREEVKWEILARGLRRVGQFATQERCLVGPRGDDCVEQAYKEELQLRK